jgi:hypothetical protein
MKKRNMLTILVAMTLALPGWADDLIPATSDDIADFDKKVSENLNSDVENINVEKNKDKNKDKNNDKSKDKKERKQNFGLIVSTEAHRLNEESGDQKKQMGKWVSDQRRQNSGGAANGGANGNSGGNGSSMSADAKNAAPGLSGSNGSSTSGGNARTGKGQDKSNSGKK